MKSGLSFFWAIVYVCMYIIALSPLHLFLILALYFWLFINNTIFVVFIFKTMKTKCTTVSIIVIQNMTIAERLVKRGASDRIIIIYNNHLSCLCSQLTNKLIGLDWIGSRH